MDTKLSSDLVFLILQFLNENKLSETARKLEQESRCYFNMEYFESQVLAGEWDRADCYLSSFTTVGENSHSTKTFFEIKKQKYLEALDMKDYARAVEILTKDLKVFGHFNCGIHKELTDLIPLGNIRENEQLSSYGDTTSQRQLVFLDLQKFIKGNPQICNKLKYPNIENSRLRILINQSLNWQHQHCKHPASIPDSKTLCFDHICATPHGSQSHTNSSIVGAIQHCVPYFPVPTHAPFPQGVNLSGRCRLSLTGRMANSEPSLPHPPVPAGTGNAFPPQNEGFVKRIITVTSNINRADCQLWIPTHVTKCSRIGPSDVNNADSKLPTDAKQSLQDKDVNKIKKLYLENVSRPIQSRTRKLAGIAKGKIVQILYTNACSSLLGLDSNGCHWRWNCRRVEQNGIGKVTVTESGIPSRGPPSHYNDPEKQISYMVLSNDDEYILSTSGAEVSLRKSQTFELVSVLLPPSPPATSFAFHPKDNRIIAFGLENSKILIRLKNGTTKILEGHHQKKITSVAFSLSLDLLISAGADGLICAWSLNGWDIQQEQFVYTHGERSSTPVGISNIKFHKDEVHLLIVQENQIAIHDCCTFDQAFHWQPQDPIPALISSAQYSCDSQLVYASFCNGAIGVFDADALMLLFSVPPAAFLLSGMRRHNIYPHAIAAHPREHNTLAIGFSDGEVHLIRLEEAVGSVKNGEGSSDPSTNNHGSELP